MARIFPAVEPALIYTTNRIPTPSVKPPLFTHYIPFYIYLLDRIREHDRTTVENKGREAHIGVDDQLISYFDLWSCGQFSGPVTEVGSSAQATAVTIGRHLNTGHLESLPIPTSVLGSTVTTPNVPAEATPTQPSSGSKRDGKKIQLQDLRNILSSVSEATKKSETPIDLNDALNVDSLRGLLEKPEIQARLLPHLPDIGDSSDHLSNLTTNIRSSQFKSMLKSFSVAFQSGELSSVLAQFHLGAKADEAARRGGERKHC
ncbi:unnamed protein product [Dicrocoelium dendriticum]|nr:unnamed protein product [Dicrocoelium dendriticum]